MLQGSQNGWDNSGCKHWESKDIIGKDWIDDQFNYNITLSAVELLAAR